MRFMPFMPKRTLPTKQHPTQFKIMLSLTQKENSSYGIAKLLKKSQSSVYEMLKPLEKADYIIPVSKHKYKLNLQRITSDFIDFVVCCIPEKESSGFPGKGQLLKNKYIKHVIFEGLLYFYTNLHQIKEKTSLDDFFYTLGQALTSYNMRPEEIIKKSISFDEASNFYKDLLKDNEFSIFDTFRFMCLYINKLSHDFEGAIHTSITKYIGKLSHRP